MGQRKNYAEVQLLNPLATPDWRYRRVLAIAKENKLDPRCSTTDDDYTRRLLAFHKLWSNKARIGAGKKGGPTPNETKQRLFNRDPDLFVAHGLRHESLVNPIITITIQARLLAGQSYEEIAAFVGCTPKVIEYYERCWFSVSDRLIQSDWVINRVVAPAYQTTNEMLTEGGRMTRYVGIARPFVNAGILLLSYRGGPVVCEYLLGGRYDRNKLPTTTKQAEKFIAEHAINSITRRAAIAAEEVILHADNVTEMFRVFAQILDVQRRADQENVGQDGAANKFYVEMRKVIEVTKDQWFAPNVDPHGMALRNSSKYDEEGDELRSGDLARLAAGVEPSFERMPDREPKPLLKPDQLRDRLAGSILIGMNTTKSLEGVNGESN